MYFKLVNSDKQKDVTAIAKSYSRKRRLYALEQCVFLVLYAAGLVVADFFFPPEVSLWVLWTLFFVTAVVVAVRFVTPLFAGEATLLYVSGEALKKAGHDYNEHFYFDNAHRPQNTHEHLKLGVSQAVMIDLRRGRAYGCKCVEGRWLLDSSVQFRALFDCDGDLCWYECQVLLPNMRQWQTMSFSGLARLLSNQNIESYVDDGLLRECVEMHWQNAEARACIQRDAELHREEAKQASDLRENLAEASRVQQTLALQLLAALVGLTVRERGGVVQQQLRNFIAVDHGPLLESILGDLYDVEWLIRELKQMGTDDRVNSSLAVILCGSGQEAIKKELCQRKNDAGKAGEDSPRVELPSETALLSRTGTG